MYINYPIKFSCPDIKTSINHKKELIPLLDNELIFFYINEQGKLVMKGGHWTDKEKINIADFLQEKLIEDGVKDFNLNKEDVSKYLYGTCTLDTNKLKLFLWDDRPTKEVYMRELLTYLSQPLLVQRRPQKAIITLRGVGNYTIEVTNNALDEQPVWEDIGDAHDGFKTYEFKNQLRQDTSKPWAFDVRLRLSTTDFDDFYIDHFSYLLFDSSDANAEAINKRITELVEYHATRRDNPHHVTAEQVGTYTKEEIDAKFLLNNLKIS